MRTVQNGKATSCSSSRLLVCATWRFVSFPQFYFKNWMAYDCRIFSHFLKNSCSQFAYVVLPVCFYLWQNIWHLFCSLQFLKRSFEKNKGPQKHASSCFFVYACVHMPVCVCVCVWVPIHALRSQWRTSVVFLYNSIPLRQTLFLTEPEAYLFCLAREFLGSACLCPQCWGYRTGFLCRC